MSDLTPEMAEHKPLHAWNDPNDDGHDCANCAPDSTWKCDRDAHLNGPYSLLSEQERADLDANLREMAATRRRGNASAATMRLGGVTATGEPHE